MHVSPVRPGSSPGVPHTVGFDYSYVIPASLDMDPYVYIENGRVTDPPSGTVPSRPTTAVSVST